MKKTKKLLCLFFLFSIINSANLYAATINVSGTVLPGDADPFNVIPGPAGSGECRLSWHTDHTPNIDIQRLWIFGPQGPGIDTTSRDLPFQIVDGGPGPDADEALIIDNLVIGETYTFSLYTLAGTLMSPGVWTDPPTCVPTWAVDAPVLDPLPAVCGTEKLVSWTNDAVPDLRCQVTASQADLGANPLGDATNIYSDWVDCSAGTGSWNFTTLSTSKTYYYHVQATTDPANPPTGGFSLYSVPLDAYQSACGGGSSSTPSPYCGDGIVNTAGEECDDGNTRDGDGCSIACKLEELHAAGACGNSIIEEGEECDDGNTVSLDGCSDVCMSEEIVNVTFTLKGKPEYRTVMPTHPNLGLIANLEFYKPINGSLTSGPVVLDNYGNGTFNALLYTGIYDIGLNGEAHNTKTVRTVEISKTTGSVLLDYTAGNTWQLTAGDTKDNNQVDALDMAKLIAGYKATEGVNDLNKAGGVNAMDIAILIWNYRKAGDPLIALAS